LIKKEKPIFSRKAKSGVVRYYLADNFYEFWFRFMSRFQALREINQKERAFEKIWEMLPEYEGFKLEALIKRIFIELNPFDLEFNQVGRHWDRKGENEIDLIFMDDDSGKAYVVEVKRSLAKSLKKDEKIKLYTKVASVIPLANHEVHYFYAGIHNQDIVIIDENNKKFVL